MPEPPEIHGAEIRTTIHCQGVACRGREIPVLVSPFRLAGEVWARYRTVYDLGIVRRDTVLHRCPWCHGPLARMRWSDFLTHLDRSFAP